MHKRALIADACILDGACDIDIHHGGNIRADGTNPDVSHTVDYLLVVIHIIGAYCLLVSNTQHDTIRSGGELNVTGIGYLQQFVVVP